MIKYYCDICGSELTSKEKENELSISLSKAGWAWGERETFNFCNKCGEKLNLESIRKALILIPYDEKRKADE